jgi:hypothetical protein
MRHDRLFNKLLCTVLIICGISAAQTCYKPLSRNDRKELKEAAAAIRVALGKGRYAEVREFAPPLIDKFKSVTLDPQSELYRKFYEEIKAAYQNSLDANDLSSWEERLRDADNDSIRIELRDQYITHLDSLVKSEEAARQKKLFEKEVKAYVDNASAMSAYEFISRLVNVPNQYKSKVKAETEKQCEEIMVQLCSTTDIGKLREFQSKYPDLYAADIQSLISQQQSSKRLQLLKKPSGEAYLAYVAQTGDTSSALKLKVRRRLERDIRVTPSQEKFEDYFRSFNDPDEQIMSAYDEFLYAKFRQNISVDDALAYLEVFPEGKKAVIIRTWIRSIENYGEKTVASDNADRSGE